MKMNGKSETVLARRALLTGALGMASSAVAAQTQGAAPAAAPPAQNTGPTFPAVPIPVYSDDIMSVVNLHEFEARAKNNISDMAYNYIRAGAGDDLTLKANLNAFGDYWVRRKVMRDVSQIDTSMQLFGEGYEHPVILGPVGLRRLLHPDGDRLTILAAHKAGAILIGPRNDLIVELTKQNQAPKWWAFSLGHRNREDAQAWAKRMEDQGASALCVGLDYPYTGLRDRPSRDQWEAQWSETPQFNTAEGVVQFQPGQIWPYFPNMTWEWFRWVKGASKLPIVAKGITNAADARMAVKAGADAISVSNHGGRTLDGAIGTLRALPEVSAAVGPRVPVIMDGGVRRGGDVIKAAALGARAVIIGRPYLWALAAFGQEGVQRSIEVLAGETRIALGLSGAARLNAVDRTFIREAWKAA
jgi:isopentenyl diphosphate isomerase/L-lactate dehydrogenase-like FMN-dependent dehydrogenase